MDKQTSTGIFKSTSPERERYYHSHQRKLAKQEIDDAFNLRGRVIAGMCITSALGLAGIGWCLLKAWETWGFHLNADSVGPG